MVALYLAFEACRQQVKKPENIIKIIVNQLSLFKTVIVWPELTPDTIEVLTTLYKGPNDEAFEDKVGYFYHLKCKKRL